MMVKEGWDVKYTTAIFFSETRLPNWAAKVYKHFMWMFPSLLRTLEENKMQHRTGESTEHEKAKMADDMQKRMYNTLFALSLSMMVDIYQIYSLGTNILQVIFLK